MKTKETYYALQAELLEAGNNADINGGLENESVDRENIDASWGQGGETPPDSPEFWADMINSAEMNAGMRAEEAGHDINELLGRVVY